MIRARQRRAIGLVLTWVGALCLPAPAGAEQDASTLETISVVRVVLRPKGQYDIAVTPEEYRLGLISLLRENGFNALGGESVVFGKDKSREARFQLGGTIEEIACEYADRRIRRHCEITVTWQVLDTRIDEVRYAVRTRYLHETDFSMLKEAFPKMIGGSLLSMTRREKFIALITKDAKLAGPDPVFSEAGLERCPGGRNPLPKGLEKALGATVLIKNGNSIGSGFFVSPDGYLLTAAHVVASASEVDIRTHGGDEMAATVVRRNRVQDVALLKVDAGSPGCLPMGGPGQVGEEIYGIGAPASEELAFSVSKGVVSGLRAFEGNQYLQTDTSLNPGNSGGPLIDMEGRAVALVSWKLSIPGFEGIAFGVPVGTALSTLAVRFGDQTTVTAKEIAAAGKSDPGGEPVLIVDEADPSQLEALQKRRAEAREARSVAADEQRRRTKAASRERRERSRPVLKKVWFVSSLLLGVAGAGMIGGTYAKVKAANPSRDEFDTLTVINTAGWVLAGVGVGSVGLFYLTGNRLSSRPPERAAPASQRGPDSRTAVGIGLSFGGVIIEGSF